MLPTPRSYLLLYVNDLPNHVQSPAGIKIFADDTKLYLGYTENQNTPLMQSLHQFCSSSKTWQLTVAYSKCSVISFGSHGYEPTSPYSLSGIPLQFVSSIRDLGVCLNSDLTPSMHCSNIAAMAFNRSCLLLKCFHSNDVSLLVRLYKVYVRPLLESIIPKFGIPGSIKIFNVLNAFRDFSLVPYSNVLVYHIWIMMIALRTWVYSP